MLTLARVRELLVDRRLDKVAEGTGLSPMTVARVRDGKGDVKATTLEKLSAYLEAQAVQS